MRWTIKRLIALIAVLCSFSCQAPAQKLVVSSNNSGWHILKGAGGGGGFERGIDIKTDGTKVARPDTYGAFLWNSTVSSCGNAAAPQVGCWQQIVLQSNMPSGTANVATGVAAYEIRACQSNTSHFYMYYGDGNIYASTNRGVSWTATAFATLPANGNDDNAAQGKFSACDEANESVFVTGTPFNAAFYTLNGGTSYTAIQTIPPSLRREHQ